MKLFRALTVLILGLGLAPALSAQTAPPVADEETLTLVERWQADPTQVFDASEVTLSDLRFIARPVIVFADSPADPRFSEQVDLLLDRIDDLAVRDVIVIVDSDPDAGSDARTTLRPRGFGLVVMGKDGRVAQRKPTPWSVREISRAIDKLPLRQQELRDGHDTVTRTP